MRVQHVNTISISFVNIEKLDTDLIFMTMILLMIMVSDQCESNLVHMIWNLANFGWLWPWSTGSYFRIISSCKTQIGIHINSFDIIWTIVYMIEYDLNHMAHMTWALYEFEIRAQLRHTVRKMFHRSEEKYWTCSCNLYYRFYNKATVENFSLVLVLSTNRVPQTSAMAQVTVILNPIMARPQHDYGAKSGRENH